MKYLMNLAARLSITHIARDTEICSTYPWQEHPSTRDRLGTAEPKQNMEYAAVGPKKCARYVAF